MDGKNVLRKIGLLLSVAACGALVTSCGDDETPTPTPTSSDTATPTPTPTAAVDFSLTADFSATSFNANYVFAFFTPDGGGTEVFNGGTRLDGTSSITFVASPDSASFVFPDLTDPVEFGATDFVSVTATERQYAAGDMALTLFLPFDNVMRVSYEIDNQTFTQDTVDGILRSQRVAIFFNNVTTTDEITTTLSYTGPVDVFGGDPGVTEAGTLSAANPTFTVTPGATSSDDDTVSGTIEVFEDVMGTPTLVAVLDLDATVTASGVFEGTGSDAANDLDIGFVGTLAGDNREEIFILFAARDVDVAGDPDDGDDTVFVGSFIGN